MVSRNSAQMMQIVRVQRELDLTDLTDHTDGTILGIGDISASKGPVDREAVTRRSVPICAHFCRSYLPCVTDTALSDRVENTILLLPY